ncbi:MAG: right-handed parallel beta-helix repeat-containing protein [Verrucomicrobiota bacterium]
MAATLRAVPVVTLENFNELGGAYQAAPNAGALTGLPAGIEATFVWNCELMWSPGFDPPDSTATNNIQFGGTSIPGITFSKPVVLWSLAAIKYADNLSLVGKLNGVQVWSYTNSDENFNAWFTVTRGAAKAIDELDVNCVAWEAAFTDFHFSDASGITPFTNSSPYYVDVTNSKASDYNPGTQALPWQSLGWAAATLQAGDTVYIKAGTYSEDLIPANSGESNAWITYSAYPGQEQQVVLDHAGVFINQESYIKISGLRVQYPGPNTESVGIYVQGPGGNYVISGNYTYDTFSSGIAFWGVPWQSDPGIYNYLAISNVLIESNTIEKGCDGGWGEQLDIANGVDSFQIHANIVKNGTNAINGGEGIDCKEGASNGKIWGNEIFNIRRYGIYLEAGASDPAYYKIRPALSTNISAYNNLIHNNDAHGIGITSEGLGDMNGIYVYNNICYSNGGDGILLYDFNYTSAENYASNITIINNTTYNNNTSTSTPYYGGIATDHHYAQNVIVRNNIAFETLQSAFGIKTPENPATVMDHNISTASDPGFLKAANGDFHLKSTSAAIGAGSPIYAPRFDFAGSVRPYDSRFDEGAYEYIPSTPFYLAIICPPGQSTPSIALHGGPESHYRVDWSARVNGPWTPLQDIPSLPCSPYGLSDSNSISGTPQRFYRAVWLTP